MTHGTGTAGTGRSARERVKVHDRLARSRPLLLAVRLALLALVLIAYSVLLVVVPATQRFLPTIPELLGGFQTIATDGLFWSSLRVTVSAGGLALLICLVAGGAIGLLLSLHRNAYGSAQFVIDFMRTIPPLALIPIGLLILGPTMQMEVALIIITAIWPVIIQTYFAVRDVDRKLLEIGRSYRVQRWRRIAFIVIPAIGPAYATSVRLSATLCLILAIGTELLASGSGLGYLVGRYQLALRIPETYATIIVIGLLGVIVNVGLMYAERRLFAWRRFTAGSNA